MSTMTPKTAERIGRLRRWAFGCLIVLGTGATARAGDPGAYDPGGLHPFRRFAPAGGWHPDDGGLLRWWDPGCFPRCGSPDDYCRKPPPRTCWPPYPPFYVRTSVGPRHSHLSPGR